MIHSTGKSGPSSSETPKALAPNLVGHSADENMKLMVLETSTMGSASVSKNTLMSGISEHA